MKKYFSSVGSYALQLPHNWCVEETNENCTNFFDNTLDVGALQISSYSLPSHQLFDPREELATYLKEQKIDYKKQNIQLSEADGTKRAQCSCVDLDGDFWRFWIFVKSDKVLFVTYNCTSANHKIQEQSIEKIIATLEIV